MAKAIGWWTSGSPAKSVTLNPSGTVIAFAASSGESPAWRKASGPVGRFGDLGLGVVEPEVVEVDVAPAPGVVVDQPDEDLLARRGA